jgi:hypothetical protein
MNISEQIEIMKFEARLANRATGEGIRNWTPEARAASLAVRRAAGSVWGWNKRARAAAPSATSEGFDSSMDALNEDSAAVRRSLAIQAGGGKVLSARPAAYDEIAAQRLEVFKAWLAEVKRTETAIDDFNGIVAAAGGLMGGAAKAQRGQSIGPVTADAAAEAAAKKVAFEKSIRRKYEKNNADYLRKNPDERGTMLDMVAEKAEYYSASPARKVQMEKDAYRQIRDSGSTTMRETPAAKGADYKTLLEAKRSYVRERDAVRPQLQADEVAYPIGNGIWIGRLPNGDERVISGVPETGGMYNRAHSAACASSKGEQCDCSCGGSQHGTDAAGSVPDGNGKSMKDYIADGFSSLDPDWAAKTVRRIEEREKWGKKITAAEKRLLEEYNAHVEEMNKKGGAGKEPVARVLESGVMTSGGPVKLSGPSEPEESEQWDNLVSGFKSIIDKGSKPTLRNLQSQLEKDHDEQKFKLASAALTEAYNTTSLDKFQDKFGRDPSNNSEFRTFQKSIGVPPEFIGEK